MLDMNRSFDDLQDNTALEERKSEVRKEVDLDNSLPIIETKGDLAEEATE